MKKALAIFAVLAVVAGATFADTFGNEAAVAVEGDAKVTWGVSLDDNMPNGFKNEANWAVKIPLLTKQTFTSKGEGDNYAEISIVDAQYNINGEDGDNAKFTGGDKKIDKVTAKVVFGDVYVKIYDKPGFKTNNAEIWAPIKNDGYFDDGKEGKDLRFEPGVDANGGVTVGYKTETMDIGFKLGSQLGWSRDAATADTTTYDWVDADDDETTAPVWTAVVTSGKAAASRKSQYVFGVDASLNPTDMVSVSGTVNYAMWARTSTSETDGAYKDGIMSLGAKAVLKPIDGLTATLALDAGNDYVVSDKAGKMSDAFAMDVLASVAYKFAEAGVYYASAGTPYETVAYDDNLLDGIADAADVAAYVKLTDGDFVENLDGWLTVMVEHALTDADTAEKLEGFKTAALPLRIGTGASYKVAQNDVNYIKPFFELYAQNMHSAYKAISDEFVTSGKVGVEYGLLTKATVTAQYEAGATQDNNRMDLIKTASRTTKGLFTLACKVTY